MNKKVNTLQDGSLGVVKNIEFKIVAYLPRFFMLIFVKFYVFVYRILLYSVIQYSRVNIMRVTTTKSKNSESFYINCYEMTFVKQKITF